MSNASWLQRARNDSGSSEQARCARAVRDALRSADEARDATSRARMAAHRVELMVEGESVEEQLGPVRDAAEVAEAARHRAKSAADKCRQAAGRGARRACESWAESASHAAGDAKRAAGRAETLAQAVGNDDDD
jgi:hypothetical protein